MWGIVGYRLFSGALKVQLCYLGGKTSLRGHYKELDNVETCKEDSQSFPEFHCAEVTTESVMGDVLQTTLDAPPLARIRFI